MGGTSTAARRTQTHRTRTPSLVLWHAKDPRLQSQQIVQEQQDRAFNYLSEYRIADNKFVRLSDDALRTVTPIGHDHFAYGIDTRDYEQPAATPAVVTKTSTASISKTGEREAARSRSTSRRRAFRRPNGKQTARTGATTRSGGCIDLATGEKHEHHEGRARRLRQHRRRSQQSRYAAARRRSAGRRTAARCCSPTAGTSGRCRRTAAARR